MAVIPLRMARTTAAASDGLALVGTGKRHHGEHRCQRHEQTEDGFTHCLLLKESNPVPHNTAPPPTPTTAPRVARHQDPRRRTRRRQRARGRRPRSPRPVRGNVPLLTNTSSDDTESSPATRLEHTGERDGARPAATGTPQDRPAPSCPPARTGPATQANGTPSPSPFTLTTAWSPSTRTATAPASASRMT